MPQAREKSKSKSKSRERKGNCFLCERPTTSKCPSCDSVYYCSQDHFLAHRHQNYCFPFRVKWRSGKGRCLVATRDIKPMELIMIDAAIAHGPQNLTSPVCLECGKEVDGSYNCGMCNMPLCGEACQVGATHYNECQIFRTLRDKINITDFEEKESPVYQCITPLRLLMKKNTHPKWFRRLVFLMDHKEEREQESSMWSQHQKNVVDFLLQTCNLNFTKEDVMWAIGLLKTNSILFGDEKARALFPMFSLINHSCSANAKHTIYIKNRRIAVQAQTEIKEGEEILINYTAFIIGTSHRRKKLFSNWYFNCLCKRCEDPTELGTHLSSLLCPKCDQTLKVSNGICVKDNPTNGCASGNLSSSGLQGIMTQVDPLEDDSPWKCQIHNFVYTKENVDKLVTDLKRHFLEVGGTSVEKAEELLKMFSEYLHPSHHLMMIVKRNIISLYSQRSLTSLNKDDFERIKELCEDSIEVLGKVDPGYPLWKAETLKDLSTSTMNLARTKFELGEISRPEFLMLVKKSMKMVEEASNCKSCVKIERKMDNGETLKEEYSNN